ncbi:uncharacterized protein LOC143300584 [Babylonia areolata]|uniref:uncharacterized protein LOC143300584 n=1 Tax=Babylonia areolata TaxID=304850 RepID=UPI003FD2C366
MATMWFVLVAVLPAVVVGYSPKTEYIEDYCGRGSYRLSKDMILRFSDTRSIIPKAPYTCSMAVQSKDTSRQLQVRVLMLDMARKSTCSSGALGHSGRRQVPHTVLWCMRNVSPQQKLPNGGKQGDHRAEQQGPGQHIRRFQTAHHLYLQRHKQFVLRRRFPVQQRSVRVQPAGLQRLRRLWG